MDKNIILNFDAKEGELLLIIGDSKFIIEKFIRDSTGNIHQKVLTPDIQKVLIKKLVSNL